MHIFATSCKSYCRDGRQRLGPPSYASSGDGSKQGYSMYIVGLVDVYKHFIMFILCILYTYRKYSVHSETTVR